MTLMIVKAGVILVSTLSPITFFGEASAGDFMMGTYSAPSPFPTLNVDSREGTNTSLRVAAREGRVKELLRLIEQGADPNGKSAFGQTALMYAARFNQIRAAEVLIEHGAEPNERDDHDTTALMMATMNCSHRIVSQLLKAQSDVNWTNHEGRNALIYASRDGCIHAVKALLNVRGIKVNHRDDGDKTAMDYAVEEANIEVDGPYTETVAALRQSGGRTHKWTIVPRERPENETVPIQIHRARPIPNVPKKLP